MRHDINTNNKNEYKYYLQFTYYFHTTYDVYYTTRQIMLLFFWLHQVFIAVRGLSLTAFSSLRCAGFSLQWLLLLWSSGSRHVGFSSCGMQAQQSWLAGSRAQAQQFQCTGLVALQHVGSSQTRAQTRVPCIGRQILNHCATRQAPSYCFLFNYKELRFVRRLAYDHTASNWQS